jgi:hypothetical protein
MRLTLATIMTLVLVAPAFAQTATGVGVGTARSTAVSTSRATAIGGGNATGGAATVTIAPNPAVTSTTVNNTGTQTIRNVPTEFAPGLAAAGLETCLGSISGGGAFVGTGFSFGSTIPDPGCAARLDARTLWAFGLKKAAVARLCLNGDIERAMPEVCAAYLPQYRQGVIGNAYAAAGTIMLVEGTTGRERPCSIYQPAAQKCLSWADEHPKKRIAKRTPSFKGDPLPVDDKHAEIIP